jgi:hypothetical protein
VTWRLLRRLPTYEDFTARFPWTSRADVGGPFVTSEDEWRDACERLRRYHAGLEALRRRASLREGENPYLALHGLLMAPPLSPGLAQVLNLRERRRELAALFSWAIPTDPTLDVLARHGPLVECGAGMGYWTALLQARGVDAVAYDRTPPGGRARNEFHPRARSPWARVHRASSVTAVRRHPDRTLLLCWPPYDDDDASYAPLRAYRGDVVVHVGERDEGATGSVRFHRELRLNWSVAAAVDLPHWPGLRDQVTVYRRNPVRRAHRERDRCDECRRFVRTGSLVRCAWCFERRPSALAIRAGAYRVEYAQADLDAMPAALRKALEASPRRIR